MTHAEEDPREAPDRGLPDSHIPDVGFASHGPHRHPGPPSRGPSMAPDAAAAGKERGEPPGLPREPRLDPGSGAGVTKGGKDPCSKDSRRAANKPE